MTPKRCLEIFEEENKVLGRRFSELIAAMMMRCAAEERHAALTEAAEACKNERVLLALRQAGSDAGYNRGCLHCAGVVLALRDRDQPKE